MRLILLFVFIIAGNTVIANPDIQELRELYYKAAMSKKSWKRLCKLLSPVDTKSPAVLVCYKGASLMMEAKYSISPWSKLNSFRSGKRLIEEAVRRDSQNPEIRFLRYSIQTNLPSFLDYDDDISSDRMFLIANASHIKDKALKDNIIQYLSEIKALNKEEIKGLKNDR